MCARRTKDGEAAQEATTETLCLGSHLENPGCFMGADRADPRAILAGEGDRSPARRMAAVPERHHLSPAERMPMEPTAQGIRRRQHRAPLVWALEQRRRDRA